MSRERVRWQQVERYFEKRGYFIYPIGRNMVIAAPQKGGLLRKTVVIPHNCCDTRNAEVTGPILDQLRCIFGVTREDIIKG